MSGLISFVWTGGRLPASRRNYCKFGFLQLPKKNYSLGRHSKTHAKLRLLWSCLKPPAGFAEREKKLYIRLDCCSEWLLSLYLWLVACDIPYVGWIGCSYLSGSGFTIMKKQYLSSFVAGRGISVSCICMYSSINFQTNSCGFFVCLFFSGEIKLHFLVF